MDLSIIIPCYNEAENVPKLEKEFLPVIQKLTERYSVEVIFVDDGSSDGTYDALRTAFASLLLPNISFEFRQHPTNLGLGAALKTGFAKFQGTKVVTTDSDGTYRFETIPDMVAYLDRGVDIVTASPYHPNGGVVGVPKYRLILSQGASFLYRLLVEWKVHTYTCLYRAYRREVIDQIKFESNGFLAGTELMVKGMLKGFVVAEFPAVLHRRVFGASKAKLARTVFAHLQFQWWVFLYKLRLAH
jgi:dolichol-phosphate mannosyltransferase